MKFLVVRLGSMGKRRINNVQYLKVGEVIGFNIPRDGCSEAEEDSVYHGALDTISHRERAGEVRP